MSSEQKHHEELVNGVYSQLKQILDSSEQAIYLYLDDTHKVCNKKFATLLGYASPEDYIYPRYLMKLRSCFQAEATTYPQPTAILLA